MIIKIQVVLIGTGLNSALCCKSRAGNTEMAIRKTTLFVVTLSFTLYSDPQSCAYLCIELMNIYRLC